MISYEEQQKLYAMPRTMTISEIREELDRLNINYNFIDYQGSIEFYEMYSSLDLVNKEIKIHVSQTIKEVVSKAEIITDAKRKDAILVTTMLEDNRKMGEVAIENDEGTNIIFHTNKKRAKEFERLKSSLVETPTPSTHHSKLAGELMGKNPSGANAHSANFDEIIPQTKENQSIAEQIKAESKDFNTLSSNEKLALLEKNQQAITGIKSTKDLQQNKDSMNQETQIHKLKKRK
ncbi:hypothetical protein [Helicobacter ganmani]|uniref:hypothetical protein n=1 Tax=Helicobacter ganmani TaxID=60246 RepID=UPI003A8B7E85